MACSGIHNVLAFGLDSTLHEDPGYFRSGAGSVLRRAGQRSPRHYSDASGRGRETLSVWRPAAHPERLNPVKLGFAEGSVQAGLDVASNLAAESWHDVKRMLRRKQ